MKKRFLVLPLTLSSLLVVGCDVTSSELPNSSSSTNLDTSKDNTVQTVLGKLDGEPLVFSGHYEETEIQGEEEYPRNSFNVDTALTDSYFFFRTQDDTYGLDETLINKDSDGYPITYQLNPITNEVAKYYYGNQNMVFPFDDLFMNPFEKSKRSFEVVDNKITLVDVDYFSMPSLINVLTVGIGFDGYTDFESLTITYENDVPKAIDVVCYNNEYLEYGSSVKMHYSGVFSTVDAVKVRDIVEPRTETSAHQKLRTMFEEIRKGNYTVDVTSETKVEDPEEWGDELPELRKAKVYVTQDGYFQDYISGVWGSDEGAYKTDDGLVEFEITEDNKLKERKQAYFSRTVDTYFGYAFSYSPASFDVNADGSYTLATEKGFYSYVWTDLLPDLFGVSVGMMDTGSLKLVIDEEANTLSYTYTCLNGSEIYSTKITNIGTTVLPIQDLEVVKYVPFTNWTEFCDSSSWNKETGQALDLLTNGNKDILPFIDSPYNYQMGVDYDGDYDFNTNTTNITWFTSMEKVFEVDTAYEQAKYVDHFFNQLFANPKYVWDKETDTFTYKDGDNINFIVKVSTVQNYNSMDGLFKFGVVLEIKNLLQNPNGEEL